MKKQLLTTLILATAFTLNAQSPWAQKADMPTERWGTATCVLDGKIYAIGGARHYADSTFNAMEVYDPASDTWTTKTPMPTAREWLTASVVNGKIYAIGGGVTSGGGYQNMVALSTVEEYDPETDTWTIKSDMPTARNSHCAFVIYGKIYILFGGLHGAYGPYTLPIEVYDPETDTWTQEGEVPLEKSVGSVCSVDGKIYVFGGYPDANLSRIDEYDPETGTWTRKADMPIKRMGLTASAVDGKVYIIGGHPGRSPWEGLASVDIYDPATEIWEKAFDMPTARVGQSASVVDGKIYIIGGISHANSGYVAYNTVEEYDPHHDLFTLLESFSLNKDYVVPENDSILFSIKMEDTAGISLSARIESPDLNPLDSLQLFDDGSHSDGNTCDSIYANVWPVNSPAEQHYYIDLHATRYGEDTVRHHMNNLLAYTTIGPVSYEQHTWSGYDSIPNAGDRIQLSVQLRNEGTSAAAIDLKAILASLDTNLAEVPNNIAGYDDIAAGESTENGTVFIVSIKEDCLVGTEVMLEIRVSSGDFMFWRDTFAFTVMEPVNEVAEPRAFEFRIYPNPAADRLSLEFEEALSTPSSVMLFDIAGKLVYSEMIENTDRQIHTLNLSFLREGLYLLRISNARYSVTEKVVKVD